ncbi:hypothetical protein EYE40_02800 [Glaciihabitans arcticus]|uniref:DUF3137 domain-containing protein n=1 Tax=Glaciihabitans arcticus TaxID=2668039 RepID=A0A4Q9GNP3_9MICO|nr:hypothetical protein [Glaciihabitans arcticus]TBN56412.1 hypothetical protein EYE40_02800 [Glaciihabitans arcticus]
MNRTINYEALISPVTREQVREFRTGARNGGELWAARMGPQLAIKGVATIVTVVVLALFALVFLRFIGNSFSTNGANPVGMAATGFVILFLVVAGIVVFAALRGSFGTSRWEKWMRLSRFAAANGLSFSPEDKNPQYPGAIFDRGDSRVTLDHLTSTTGRFFDMGNYRYQTGSGDSRATHNWGFMAFNLDRKLPHMVLDATSNNGLFGGSNLGVSFTKDQVLSLEGDFGKHFTLYCPRQYERDALYVFTPDLMALLIDEASPFDVEIVDDWMFVYSATPFVPTDPAVYQRLFRIIDTVGAKTLTQTDRYADERIGDSTVNLVAPQGQRLKRGGSVIATIAIVAFVAYWAWSFFGSIIGFGR